MQLKDIIELYQKKKKKTSNSSLFKLAKALRKTKPTSLKELKRVERNHSTQLPMQPPDKKISLNPNTDIHTYKMGGITKHCLVVGGKHCVGSLDVSHTAMDNGPTVGESYIMPRYQGKGYGTKLYEHALNHHGQLSSDSATTPAADRVWEKMIQKEGVVGSLGKPKTDQRHKMFLDKSIIQDSPAMPIDHIELGDGYILVRTHNQMPDVALISQGYGQKEYFEIRHPSATSLLAALEAIVDQDKKPIIKIGYISPDHKDLNISKSIIDALMKKYGELPEDTIKYLNSVWGNSGEIKSTPNAEGKWKSVSRVLSNMIKTKNVLNKSFNLAKAIQGMKKSKYGFVQVDGHDGFHEVLNIIDNSNLPNAHELPKGNTYTFKHNQTGEPVSVHADKIIDMVFDKKDIQ